MELQIPVKIILIFPEQRTPTFYLMWAFPHFISAMYKQPPFLYNMYSVEKRFPYTRQLSPFRHIYSSQGGFFP